MDPSFDGPSVQPFSAQALRADAPEVAPLLLGALVVQPSTGVTLRVIETEAYMPGDPASHSFRGPTVRNRPMFGPSGYWYAYFVYGMHWCLNVVTGPERSGQAVLLRAAVVEDGWEVVANRRKLGSEGAFARMSPAQKLAVKHTSVDGPGKIGAALAVGREQSGMSCFEPSDLLLRTDGTALEVARVTGRVGISAGQQYQWRFCASNAPKRRPDHVR
jgi:DNA-3-methyladenine glycosylase